MSAEQEDDAKLTGTHEPKIAKVTVVPERGAAKRPDQQPLAWPPTAPQALGAGCFAIAVYLVVVSQWPAVATTVLAIALVAVLSPGLRGPVRFKANTEGVRVEGNLADPFGEQPSGQREPAEGQVTPPASQGGLPQGSSTQPTSD